MNAVSSSNFHLWGKIIYVDWSFDVRRLWKQFCSCSMVGQQIVCPFEPLSMVGPIESTVLRWVVWTLVDGVAIREWIWLGISRRFRIFELRLDMRGCMWLLWDVDALTSGVPFITVTRTVRVRILPALLPWRPTVHLMKPTQIFHLHITIWRSSITDWDWTIEQCAQIFRVWSDVLHFLWSLLLSGHLSCQQFIHSSYPREENRSWQASSP